MGIFKQLKHKKMQEPWLTFMQWDLVDLGSFAQTLQGSKRYIGWFIGDLKKNWFRCSHIYQQFDKGAEDFKLQLIQEQITFMR